ncbi:MAG: hypothetical protein U0800_15240 [Isosphaeraceae bacterium]
MNPELLAAIPAPPVNVHAEPVGPYTNDDDEPAGPAYTCSNPESPTAVVAGARALPRSRMPPVIVLPDREDSERAFWVTRWTSWAAVRFGYRPATRATAPETWGAANDSPLP